MTPLVPCRLHLCSHAPVTTCPGPARVTDLLALLRGPLLITFGVECTATLFAHGLTAFEADGPKVNK